MSPEDKEDGMTLICGVTTLCLPGPRLSHPHQLPCSRLYPELQLHVVCKSGLGCGQGHGEGAEHDDSTVEVKEPSILQDQYCPWCGCLFGLGAGEDGNLAHGLSSTPQPARYPDPAHIVGRQLSRASPAWLTEDSEQEPANKSLSHHAGDK